CIMVHMDVFQLLADPSRRGVVEALRHGEQAVNEIVARLDIDQSGVSRHLHILSEGGFVNMRADGPRRLYSLRHEPFLQLGAWLLSYRTRWEPRLDRFGRALKEKKR